MYATRRHRFLYNFLKPVVLRPFFYSRNHFKSKLYKLDKTRGNIIIANHQTTDDPFLLAGSFKGLTYPVMARDFIPIQARKFTYKWIGPILKSKNLKDVNVVVNMLRVLKEGHNIILYPEGNRTFSGDLCYIGDATAKLIKKAKANVIFYNFHGGYGFDPRYSTSHRKGKFYGELRREYKYEEIGQMSEEEILNIIKENLTVVEAPTNYSYKSKTRAEKLERALYLCPCCNKTQTLESSGNYIRCKECGLEAEYGEHLTFKANKENFKFNTVGEWFKYQEDYVYNYKVEPNKILYQDDNCILDKITDLENTNLDNGRCVMSDTYIEVNNTRYELSSIAEMTVSGKQNLIFYVGNDSIRISCSTLGFNAVKYMQMYYHIIHKESDFLGI